MSVTDLLAVHEYRFGIDTNCACGAPSIWYWEDWVQHIEPLLAAAT